MTCSAEIRVVEPGDPLYTHEWSFPDVPSLNVINNWRDRGMRWRLAKESKFWRILVMAFVSANTGARIPEAVVVGRGWKVPTNERTPAMRRHVVFERHCKRRYDHTNFVGGCKMLEDCLVKAGILVDDTEAWIQPEHTQVLTPNEKARVVVRIGPWREE